MFVYIQDMVDLYQSILWATIVIILIYTSMFWGNLFNISEGFTGTNMSTKQNNTRDHMPAVHGEASGAENYLNIAKASVTTLQDDLLAGKYSKEYGDILMQMDEYIDLMILKQALHVNIKNSRVGANIHEFNNLATMRQAKEALNDAMQYLEQS